ncbi:unnamed protein product, partial [Mesorhabditis belari]|uniref:Phospholipase n=1 Tax=Mesorhabditis belari TaxID=2138241 RepID=A0AAF3J4E5_9BILA
MQRPLLLSVDEVQEQQYNGHPRGPGGDATHGIQGDRVNITEVQSPSSIDYEPPAEESDEEGYSTDDEMQYCDCIVSVLAKSLPGTPGRKGVIPYSSIYEDQDATRRRGYWLPGTPVNAKIIKAEKNQESGIHFINKILYTIQLQHGPFKWSLVRTYRDFSVLNNRLRAHRAAERIRAPLHRVQKRMDEMFESVGLDLMQNHKEDCPYYRKQSKRERRENQTKFLKRTADAFESNNDEAPIASIDTTSPLEEEQRHKVERAVQSGILEDEPSPGESTAKKRKVRTRKRHQLPHFPLIPDSMVSNLEQRREQLESWLQMLLHIPINRNHHETAEFLEISRFSFVNDLGSKHNEGLAKKRPGGALVFYGWKQCCVKWVLPWSKRWLMVRDTFVAYMNPSSEKLRLVMLIDQAFKIAVGGKEADGMANGLIIYNSQHELHLKCRRLEDTLNWKRSIEEVMQGPGKIFTDPHRYASSFPVRDESFGKWYVDAKDFMEQASDMMELAKEEIFIADWWLSPEIYMKRPSLHGSKWRLDEILKRKAEQGIKIFILLYKEMEMALGLNSIYTKRKLQELHPNIKKLIVIDQLIAFVGGIDLCFGRWDDTRHLLTDLGSVHFDAQHNIIAQQTGENFVSAGLRALVKAPLTLGPLGLEEHEEVTPRGVMGPGGDAPGSSTSPKAADTGDVVEMTRKMADTKIESKEGTPLKQMDKDKAGVVLRVWKKEPQAKDRTLRVSTNESGDEKMTAIEEDRGRKIKRTNIRRSTSSQYRAPPLDLIVKGPAPSSVLSNAVEHGMDVRTAVEKYKNYVESGKFAEEKHRASTPPGREKKPNRISRVVSNWRGNRAKRRWKQILDQDDVVGEYELDWLRLKDLSKEVEDELDGGVKLWIGKDYVNFIVKDFVEIDLPYNDFIDRGLTPRMPWHDIHSVTFGHSARDVARHFIQRWNATKTEKLKDDDSYPYLMPKTYDNLRVPRVFKNIAEPVQSQVLRSLSNWSSLINKTEDSIQQAYVSLIANSKHYIYIENQFFVSMSGGVEVHNEICRVLVERIVRAHQDNENFRVYLLLPLMPGFEGDVGAPGGSSLQAVLHWTYRSLSRGEHSLMETLKKRGVEDPTKYISINSLRTWDLLTGRLVTELIYIHCKLMIVDDEHVIIGSANINDRSQAGNRDSEVCMIYSDTVKERSIMNGKPYTAGKFAKSLRLALMKEHLGLLPNCRRPSKFDYEVTCEDPVTPSFYVDIWQQVAKKNTRIYEEVFRAYPTDLVESFEEYAKWKSVMTQAEYAPQEAEAKLRDVKGVLVDFPLNFLKQADLAPAITSREGIVGSSVFT